MSAVNHHQRKWKSGGTLDPASNYHRKPQRQPQDSESIVVRAPFGAATGRLSSSEPNLQPAPTLAANRSIVQRIRNIFRHGDRNVPPSAT